MKKRLLTIIVILLNIQSCFAIDSAIWQTYVDFNYQLDEKKQSIIDKQNVFLFYEIYDSLWRKYGYRYVKEPFTEYYEPTFEIKSNSSSSDIDYILRKYDSEIKAGNYSNVSREIYNLGSKAQISYSPGYSYSGYHEILTPYVSEKRILNEAIQLYKKKMYITKPKPYSVSSEAKKYKKLRKVDIEFIENQFSKRLETKKIDLENKKRIIVNGTQHFSLSDYDTINPGGFLNCVKDIDKEFSKYYPQNLSIDSYPYKIMPDKDSLYFIYDKKDKQEDL